MKHPHQSVLASLALSALVFLGAASTNLWAATITVTNTADSGAGTLRAALASATNGDKINFSLPTSATITLTGTELLVTRNVSISGPATVGVGPGTSRSVLHIDKNTVVTLSSLTITNCPSAPCIYNDGAALAVSNCLINGNGFGGGIYNYACCSSNANANLTILNSTVSGNFARFGGGILNLSQGGNANLTIRNSTVSGNSANFGGGIWNVAQGGSALATILNSTVSGNIAGYAGGIWNVAEGGGSIANLRIDNSTFSGNTAGYAGGVWNSEDTGGSATVRIGSTILNAGALGGNLANEPGATFTSDGYNLSNDDGSGLLTATGDQINTDPKLGPLQDNGGTTFTHAFTCRSPAIDGGRNFSGAATDQRGVGFARMFDDPAATNGASGDGTDIGAFEAQQLVAACDLPPVADASATITLVISPNNTNATVVLDGRRSSDPDSDPLQYEWSESGSPLANGVVAVTVLPVGTHTIELVVSDGTLANTNDVVIEVITTAEAVNRLAATLSAEVPRPQPLLASLKAALASIDRSNPVSALNQLLAFQSKVRAQVAPLDPASAASLIQSAQAIVDALSGGNTNPGGHSRGKFTSLTRQSNGHMRMHFSADSTGTHIVEASTNLANWEMIGVAAPSAAGGFDFEDAQGAGYSSRFYRVRSQ